MEVKGASTTAGRNISMELCIFMAVGVFFEGHECVVVGFFFFFEYFFNICNVSVWVEHGVLCRCRQNNENLS